MRALGGPRAGGSAVLMACAGVMVATLMGVLLLNIALSRGSYTSGRLADTQQELHQRQDALMQALRDSAAPPALATAAASLGMVADPHPGYLRLADGALLVPPGAPAVPVTPVPASPTPSTATSTATDPAPTPGASP